MNKILPTLSPGVAIAAATASEQTTAKTLSDHLQMPLVDSTCRDFPHLLTVTRDRLELRDTTIEGPGPVFVDFASDNLFYRRQHGGGRREPLIRAVGTKSGLPQEVIDATAGLGRDAFLMAAQGIHVRLFERNPIIAALLSDGLKRAAKDSRLKPIIAHMELLPCDSLNILREESHTRPAEVIYLDPMYPHRTKTAKVKKEMLYLRAIVGDDHDAHLLLAMALAGACQRVVVKRPAQAPPIDSRPPDFSRKTGNHRFDVYLVR
ncbi:MAG: class I SAM-dependent methyltransferase [Proteobacteria bacterium]|nr:class I SAM-dependent methyltransferase [Pseudomonadota bacterium]MBU1688334.1 class I SAM-dependent methyltransferase [Pseudomonadota bacterium]